MKRICGSLLIFSLFFVCMPSGVWAQDELDPVPADEPAAAPPEESVYQKLIRLMEEVLRGDQEYRAVALLLTQVSAYESFSVYKDLKVEKTSDWGSFSLGAWRSLRLNSGADDNFKSWRENISHINNEATRRLLGMELDAIHELMTSGGSGGEEVWGAKYNKILGMLQAFSGKVRAVFDSLRPQSVQNGHQLELLLATAASNPGVLDEGFRQEVEGIVEEHRALLTSIETETANLGRIRQDIEAGNAELADLTARREAFRAESERLRGDQQARLEGDRQAAEAEIALARRTWDEDLLRNRQEVERLEGLVQAAHERVRALFAEMSSGEVVVKEALIPSANEWKWTTRFLRAFNAYFVPQVQASLNEMIMAVSKSMGLSKGAVVIPAVEVSFDMSNVRRFNGNLITGLPFLWLWTRGMRGDLKVRVSISVPNQPARVVTSLPIAFLLKSNMNRAAARGVKAFINSPVRAELAKVLEVIKTLDPKARVAELDRCLASLTAPPVAGGGLPK